MRNNKLAHIVCAIEPNDEARDIVNMASHVAQREGSDLTLIHIVPPMWQPYADMNFTPVIEAQVALEEDLLKTARAKLNELITSAATSSACVIVEKGDPVSAIVEHAEELGNALIVMGVHNRRGLRRLLGSTAHGVLNATDKPILLVHADDHETTRYDNVLVAVDTSAALGGVLEHAAPYIDQAKQHKIISVVQSLAMTLGNLQASAFAPNLGQISDLQSELVRAVKDTVREAVDKADLATDCIKVVEGDAAHEICAAAQAQDAELIIMGSGQRNILDRILLGSTAHGVLNNSPCDVYIAR